VNPNHDPSGVIGPRLGLGRDSGWSHLSGQNYTNDRGNAAMGLNFDEIAEDAVDEVFGFRGRPGPVRRAVRRTVARRAATRDYNRGGWGSPGWQASQGGGYHESGFEEESFLEEEPEELEDEEEYGLDFGADDEEDDEFGRRGGGQGRPVRRAVSRTIRRRRNRRQQRQSQSAAQPMDAYRTPLQFNSGSEDEPYPEEEPYPYEEEEYGGPQFMSAARYGGPQFMSAARFGNDFQAPVVVRAPQQTTFRSSLDTGLGFGLGFLGVAIGLNILASALSGRR